MDNERYQAEISVFRLNKLPQSAYRFVGMDTANPYLLIGAVTNSKHTYTLKIDLSTFPMSVPKVFVTKMLKTKSGEDMNSCSGAMHTLTAENGCTRICHYGPSSWTPNVSLFKIYVKCRLWLEMYEAHLRTGHPIDYYLNHQA